MSEYTELLRDLAKEAKVLKGEVEEQAVAEDTAKEEKKTGPEFTLTLAEYPDVIITRKSPKSMKHLVIMPSAGACFIKTEPQKGETKSEILNEKNYCSFTAGMPDIVLPEGYWTGKIKRGKVFCQDLEYLFGNPILLDAIKKGCLPKELDALEKGSCACVQFCSAYELNPRLMLEFKDTVKAKRLLFAEPKLVNHIYQLFGLDNTRDFLREYEFSLANLVEWEDIYSNRSGYNMYKRYRKSREWEKDYKTAQINKLSVLPHIDMPYASFKQYLLYDAVRYGYALSMRSFFGCWYDTLDMQHSLYGKIRDKMPKNLQIAHDQLAYKCTVMRMEIDEKKFAAQCRRASFYEGTFGNFVLVAPKSRQDFYDEATAQGNCLAGYIDRFTQGNCLILFMRYKKHPKVSYITVEIVDGKIRQMKRAMNRTPSELEQEALVAWVNKCNSKKEEAA